MPNWCNNTIKVQATKERIDEFEKFLNENDGKDWFTHFRPLPEELTNEGWYEWSINNWGCKWNCDANDWQRIDENTISFWFDSPWGPPIQAYQQLEQLGFEVRAYYNEPGMGFTGMYEGSDEFYDYSGMDADEAEEYIPETLNEMYGITDSMREWEDENEEENE